MTKTKRIEVVYEGGVFKPLEQIGGLGGGN